MDNCVPLVIPTFLCFLLTPAFVWIYCELDEKTDTGLKPAVALCLLFRFCCFFKFIRFCCLKLQLSFSSCFLDWILQRLWFTVLGGDGSIWHKGLKQQ